MFARIARSFDSASTFCRYFVHPSRDPFLGASAPQDRTYFAARLPHRWWLLGLDFATGTDIDRDGPSNRLADFAHSGDRLVGRVQFAF